MPAKTDDKAKEAVLVSAIAEDGKKKEVAVELSEEDQVRYEPMHITMTSLIIAWPTEP
jgi:hypothetical protein